MFTTARRKQMFCVSTVNVTSQFNLRYYCNVNGGFNWTILVAEHLGPSQYCIFTSDMMQILQPHQVLISIRYQHTANDTFIIYFVVWSDRKAVSNDITQTFTRGSYGETEATQDAMILEGKVYCAV